MNRRSTRRGWAMSICMASVAAVVGSAVVDGGVGDQRRVGVVVVEAQREVGRLALEGGLAAAPGRGREDPEGLLGVGIVVVERVLDRPRAGHGGVDPREDLVGARL